MRAYDIPETKKNKQKFFLSVNCFAKIKSTSFINYFDNCCSGVRRFYELHSSLLTVSHHNIIIIVIIIIIIELY
jgi:hypothetical protein